MIILEGADGSGKTTLAQKISEIVGWPLQHSGGPPKGPGEIEQRVNAYLAGSPCVVYDRFPVISDTVYAAILRRPTPITDDMIERLARFNPLIIHCHAPHEHLGVQNNPEFDTPEHVHAVRLNHKWLREGYVHYFEEHPPSVIYTWSNERDVLMQCLMHARNMP